MTGWFLFLAIWILGFPIAVLRDVRTSNSRKAWIALFVAALSFILIPIERYKSDSENKREITHLSDVIKKTEEFNQKQADSLEIVTKKNEALEKQIALLNTIKKQISKLGVRFTAKFVVDGLYSQPRYKAIAPSNPPYAVFKSVRGGNKDILFQSQDMQYDLISIGIQSTTTHAFQFSTNGEVLNAQFPIGESISILKNYDLVIFYIPFSLVEVGSTQFSPGRAVRVENIEAELLINGIKIRRRISKSEINSSIGAGFYSDQSYWITVPIPLSSSIYKTLNLATF